jgi:hypothetical protein
MRIHRQHHNFNSILLKAIALGGIFISTTSYAQFGNACGATVADIAGTYSAVLSAFNPYGTDLTETSYSIVLNTDTTATIARAKGVAYPYSWTLENGEIQISNANGPIIIFNAVSCSGAQSTGLSGELSIYKPAVSAEELNGASIGTLLPRGLISANRTPPN